MTIRAIILFDCLVLHDGQSVSYMLLCNSYIIAEPIVSKKKIKVIKVERETKTWQP